MVDAYPYKIKKYDHMQPFCNILKEYLMKMFENFQQGELPPFHLNYGIIILLPKKENAIQIQ
jgi:hypothetical protein